MPDEYREGVSVLIQKYGLLVFRAFREFKYFGTTTTEENNS